VRWAEEEKRGFEFWSKRPVVASHTCYNGKHVDKAAQTMAGMAPVVDAARARTSVSDARRVQRHSAPREKHKSAQQSAVCMLRAAMRLGFAREGTSREKVREKMEVGVAWRHKHATTVMAVR
jgi:hypothetical protein